LRRGRTQIKEIRPMVEIQTTSLDVFGNEVRNTNRHHVYPATPNLLDQSLGYWTTPRTNLRVGVVGGNQNGLILLQPRQVELLSG